VSERRTNVNPRRLVVNWSDIVKIRGGSFP
jgi:hypothetical protein